MEKELLDIKETAIAINNHLHSRPTIFVSKTFLLEVGKYTRENNLTVLSPIGRITLFGFPVEIVPCLGLADKKYIVGYGEGARY